MLCACVSFSSSFCQLYSSYSTSSFKLHFVDFYPAGQRTAGVMLALSLQCSFNLNKSYLAHSHLFTPSAAQQLALQRAQATCVSALAAGAVLQSRTSPQNQQCLAARCPCRGCELNQGRPITDSGAECAHHAHHAPKRRPATERPADSGGWGDRRRSSAGQPQQRLAQACGEWSEWGVRGREAQVKGSGASGMGEQGGRRK